MIGGLFDSPWKIRRHRPQSDRAEALRAPGWGKPLAR